MFIVGKKMPKRLTIEDVRKLLKSKGYSLLSNEYKNAFENLEVECSNGHNWSVSVNKFKDRNQRCPRCTFLGGNSKMENDLMDAIKQAYPSAKKSKIRNIKMPKRPWVKGFDLDIYIPEIKKAIEFDGTYFHSIEGLKRGYPNWPLQDLKRYHIIKDAYFSSLGIKVLHIKEKEWLKDKEKCIDKCLKFLRKIR